MKKLMCILIGILAVAWFARLNMMIDAQFSDDAILISMAIASAAGVLSAK